MGNRRLRSEQPMDGVTVASGYARRLVEGEARRSGLGIKDAVQPVARRLRASHGSVWGLLFRVPKDISKTLFDRLEAAVEREVIRDMGALENELAAIRASSGGSRTRTLAEAEASLARLKAALGGGE